MRSLIMTAIAALGFGGAPPQPVAAPLGAKVEASGFWSIGEAPVSPAPPPEARKLQNERTYYAELAGVSNAEAAKRMREQEAFRPRFERLMAEIRKKERGNYTDVELIHRPDWAYVLYFKRDPQKTLAKYTSSPRVKARSSRYTRGELQRLAQPWIERFGEERLVTGYGMNARRGTADIDMVVSEEEFAAIARRNGWSTLPEFLNLKFTASAVGPEVDPAAAAGVRIFPHGDRALGMIHMAGFHGRIVLKDGCFFVENGVPSGKLSLAYFPREVGLYVDRQGYLALRTRTSEPRHLGRIGESFTWAGPIGISEDAPMVAELRKRCGSAPLIHLSIPESKSIMEARYPHLRDLAAPPPPPTKTREAPRSN
ncbi:MAG TPA: hypothetical protein VIL42_04455 [Sphingomicrobium sp.]|jgi:hypothetical protein